MEFMDHVNDETTHFSALPNNRLRENPVPVHCVPANADENATNDKLRSHDAACEKTPRQRQELDVDRERSNQANLYLQEFVYAVSHDLKTPLRAINGFSQLLAKEYKEDLDSKGKRYIQRIVDGADQMQRLLNCCTEFSRVCSKEPQFVDVEMNELMEQVTNELYHAIKQANAVVTWDPLPTVFGDEVQILTLFRHLCENGIRFRSQTPPKIHVSYGVSESNQVFKVTDNGIGIEERDHEKVFVMFRRIGLQDSQDAGLGAGLAICRRIVERHGGQIKLESEPGVGTQIIFSIASRTQAL